MITIVYVIALVIALVIAIAGLVLAIKNKRGK